MKHCIDLESRYGRENRICRDPAYFAEYGPHARIRDPWYLRIPCKHGHIYPHGGDKLGASTDRRGAIANRLVAIPDVEVVQNGSDGINAIFAVKDFSRVAAIMRPKRRRRLSPAHRATLVAAGCKALARYRNCQVDSADHSRDRRPSATLQVDPMAGSALGSPESSLVLN
jgi:hypothetical protein